eukprot:2547960-Rhodomonas_salina.3
MHSVLPSTDVGMMLRQAVVAARREADEQRGAGEGEEGEETLVLNSAMRLRACYGMSGTDESYCDVSLRTYYSMPGTDVPYLVTRRWWQGGARRRCTRSVTALPNTWSDSALFTPRPRAPSSGSRARIRSVVAGVERKKGLSLVLRKVLLVLGVGCPSTFPGTESGSSGTETSTDSSSGILAGTEARIGGTSWQGRRQRQPRRCGRANSCGSSRAPATWRSTRRTRRSEGDRRTEATRGGSRRLGARRASVTTRGSRSRPWASMPEASSVWSRPAQRQCACGVIWAAHGVEATRTCCVQMEHVRM